MATLLGALVLVLLGLAVALRIAGQTGSGFAFAALPVAALGLLIARRQPGNRIGLLLLGCSAVLALYGDATAYSVWDYPPPSFPANCTLPGRSSVLLRRWHQCDARRWPSWLAGSQRDDGPGTSQCREDRKEEADQGCRPLLAAYLYAHRTLINGSALCAALAVTERG
jgi:hypothetical protein